MQHAAAIVKFVFYNNCVISCPLIGSFLSSIRAQTDKILSHASFQDQTVKILTNESLLRNHSPSARGSTAVMTQFIINKRTDV